MSTFFLMSSKISRTVSTFLQTDFGAHFLKCDFETDIFCQTLFCYFVWMNTCMTV